MYESASSAGTPPHDEDAVAPLAEQPAGALNTLPERSRPELTRSLLRKPDPLRKLPGRRGLAPHWQPPRLGGLDDLNHRPANNSRFSTTASRLRTTGGCGS